VFGGVEPRTVACCEGSLEDAHAADEEADGAAPPGPCTMFRLGTPGAATVTKPGFVGAALLEPRECIFGVRGLSMGDFGGT